MAKIIIIGAGAAGMAASVFLAEQGHQVHVYEKNEKPGKKLFITGKGRCNLTNSCDAETFFASVVTNPKFLYSAFYGCDNLIIYAEAKEKPNTWKQDWNSMERPVQWGYNGNS